MTTKKCEFRDVHQDLEFKSLRVSPTRVEPNKLQKELRSVYR